MSKLSVVIPIFNEENAIQEVTKSLFLWRDHSLNRNVFNEIEFVFVDDGSTDRSMSFLQQAIVGQSSCQVISLPKNLGYGVALKEGFLNTTGNLIGFMDMDNTYLPADFEKLYLQLQISNSSIALGIRSFSGNMPLLRRAGNWLFVTLFYLLFQVKIKDICTGMRLFRKELLSEILTASSRSLNYSLELSTQMQIKRIPFCQVPISYNHRIGTSKLNSIRDGFEFLFTLLSRRLTSGIK